MTWTQTTPTVEGLYWCLEDGRDREVEIVRVEEMGGVWYACEMCYEGDTNLSADVVRTWWWWGPVTPPDPPQGEEATT